MNRRRFLKNVFTGAAAAVALGIASSYKIPIPKLPLGRVTRTLRAEWTMEDVPATYGVDLEQQLVKRIAEQMDKDLRGAKAKLLGEYSEVERAPSLRKFIDKGYATEFDYSGPDVVLRRKKV